MFFAKALTLLLVTFLATGFCSPLLGDLLPGADSNTKNQQRTYLPQNPTGQYPDPNDSQKDHYPNSGEGQYPTNPYYPDSQGPAVTQQCSTYQQLCDVQACCEQLECRITSTGYPQCLPVDLSQSQPPTDPSPPNDNQQQPTVEYDKCGYYNMVPTSPSSTYPNGQLSQPVYRILSVSNRHFRDDDDIHGDAHRETTVVDIAPFPELPTGGEPMPSHIEGEAPPSPIAGGEGPSSPIVGGEGPTSPIVGGEGPPSPVEGGEETTAVPIETGEPPLTLGGGGGGGGGEGYSPGGSGGSVQGVGIAASGTPGIGIYICNSDNLEINITIGGPGGDGTGTISYNTRIKGPTSGDKGFQQNQPEMYRTTYSYKALLQEDGELGLVAVS